MKKSLGDFSIELKTPHINQEKILKSKARYRVVACGRRFGKSEAAIIAACIRLLKGQAVWVCSPTNQNSKRMFRQFERLFFGFPEDLIKINKTDMRIDAIFNFGFIEFKSLVEYQNLRGEGLDFVVIDEAAFVDDNVWDEILAPMLLSTKGDALFISSTNGKNWFWKMFQYGLDPTQNEYESFHFTSYDNPLLDPKEIDKIRERTPAYIFEREYLAVFEDDGGSVFKNVSSVLRNPKDFFCENEDDYVSMMLDKNRDGECDIVFGIDWGQMEDFTVITVFDLATKSLIEYQRINKVLWEDIMNIIKMLNEKWNPTYILAEENNAKAIIEKLQSEGLPLGSIYTSNKSKPELINKLVLAIEQKMISLPNDKILKSELESFEMKKSPSGIMKYSAPSGLHDDIVMSLAFANYCSDIVLHESAFEVISV